MADRRGRDRAALARLAPQAVKSGGDVGGRIMDHRRAFLRYLAASPFAASAAYAQAPGAEALVTRAQDGLDVFDFEAVAKTKIPPAHWGYLMTGVDGEETLKANRQ